MFTFVTIGFGIALPLALLTGNHSHANAQIGGMKLTAAERDGRTLFGEHCGVCHTLAAANAIGKVGPNLDTLKPSESVVAAHHHQRLPAQRQHQVRPGMPRPGRDARRRRHRIDATDVAKFVAKVAGNE